MKKEPSSWGSIARAASERSHKADLADSEAALKKSLARIEELESRLDVVSAIASKKESRRAMKPITLDQGEATAIICASDWHVEEVISASSTNGLNQFNLQVADERIKRFFSASIRLTEIERNGADIPDCILWLGGDLMSGYIHEELQETNELSPTETILWLKSRLEEGIALVRKNFKRTMVVCNYGNHGRTTKKPRHATGFQNSYEWLLYSILSQQINGEDISWQVADSYLSFVNVYGKTLRFHHGDGLKYQGGIGGLTIPTEKAISSWNKAKVADLDVFGHWHTQQQNPKWVSNGSLIGYNAYAVSIKASFEPPQQTFFLFDRARGRTITAPIIL
jgi:hypothetical protein